VIKDPAIADNRIMAMLILSIINKSLGEMKKNIADAMIPTALLPANSLLGVTNRRQI
jgi:hypothetical protein